MCGINSTRHSSPPNPIGYGRRLLTESVDDEIVEALKQRAVRHGSSVEVEHRKILERVLLYPKAKSFIEILKEIPDVGNDEDFERVQVRPNSQRFMD